MKILCQLVAVLTILAACQPSTPPAAEAPEETTVRFTTNAPEITTAKAGMNAYLAGDWDAMRATFADNAEVYHNTTEPVGPDQSIANLKEGLESVSSYRFDDEQYWERIIDDEGETWVYFWGTWNADHATSDKVFEVPVHLAWHYQNGKVVEEFGLWDTSQMLLAEMEAAE
jgi:hypothetical protein